MTAPPRVLLLVPARTYRAADFLIAAGRMHLDLVVASDGALPLGGRPVIPVSPADLEASTRRILARAGPVGARGDQQQHARRRRHRFSGEKNGSVPAS